MALIWFWSLVSELALNSRGGVSQSCWPSLLVHHSHLLLHLVLKTVLHRMHRIIHILHRKKRWFRDAGLTWWTLVFGSKLSLESRGRGQSLSIWRDLCFVLFLIKSLFPPIPFYCVIKRWPCGARLGWSTGSLDRWRRWVLKARWWTECSQKSSRSRVDTRWSPSTF